MRGACVGLILWGCLAGTAHAGPWAQGQGGWYARAVWTSETLEGADGHRGDVYAEYGAFQDWTFTAKAETVSYDGTSAFDRDSYRLSVRHQFWSHEGWAAGLEAGPVYGSTITSLIGCEAFGLEGRASVGYSGYRKELPFYTFLDAAYVQHEDGCHRQRMELGYGADIGSNLFISQQLWVERGNQSAASDKYESQIGYHFPLFDLSVGYREEFGSDFDEEAFLVAITARR